MRQQYFVPSCALIDDVYFLVHPFLRISIKMVLYDDTMSSMTASNDWQGLVTQGKR